MPHTTTNGTIETMSTTAARAIALLCAATLCSLGLPSAHAADVTSTQDCQTTTTVHSSLMAGDRLTVTTDGDCSLLTSDIDMPGTLSVNDNDIAAGETTPITSGDVIVWTAPNSPALATTTAFTLSGTADATYSVTTTIPVVVEAPSAVGNLIGVAGDSQAALTWTAPDSGTSPITDYLVEYKTSSATTWTSYNDTVSASAGATVNGLTNGTSYLFRVYAVTAAGTSPASNEVTLTPAPAVSVPDAPSGLSGKASSRKLTVTWKAPSKNGSAITDYTIAWTTTSAPTDWTTLIDPVGTNTTATITNLTNGTTVLVRVSATNGIGTGPWSATLSTTMPAATKPGAPSALTATAKTNDIALTWTAPTDDGGAAISDYLIEYNIGGAATWTTYSDTESAITSATMTGLKLSGQYLIRVSAINSVGTGTASKTATVTLVIAGTPTTPVTPTTPPVTGTPNAPNPGKPATTGITRAAKGTSSEQVTVRAAAKAKKAPKVNATVGQALSIKTRVKAKTGTASLHVLAPGHLWTGIGGTKIRNGRVNAGPLQVNASGTYLVRITTKTQTTYVKVTAR